MEFEEEVEVEVGFEVGFGFVVGFGIEVGGFLPPEEDEDEENMRRGAPLFTLDGNPDGIGTLNAQQECTLLVTDTQRDNPPVERARAAAAAEAAEGDARAWRSMRRQQKNADLINKKKRNAKGGGRQELTPYLRHR